MQQTFQRAMQFHQAGRLEEAESLYRQLLAKHPANARILHLLGLAAYQRGDISTAITEIRKATEADPSQADYFSNLGLVLRAQGHPQQAVAAYRTALGLAPHDAAIHNNLGSALQDLELLDEAESSYRASLELEPENPSTLFNLGNLLSQKGSPDEATRCYRLALNWMPQDADIHNNLGNVLRETGQLEDALACYREALRLQPGYPGAARHQGWLLQELGRTNEAIPCYLEATRHNHDDDVAHFNLGNALRTSGRFAEAVASYREAIRLKPDDAEMFNNMGNALRELGRLQEAIDCYRHALQIDPALHHARAHLLHQSQHACDWRELDSLSTEVRRLVNEVPEAQIAPFAFLAVPDVTAAAQRRCAENWVTGQFAKYGPLRERLQFSFKHAKKMKIRLGYLSADFHEHATAYLMAEVFELHDHAHFEIVAYSYGPDDGSPMRARLNKAFEQFEDIRALTLEQAARKIHADGIDILIDLKGYTAHNRSEILALRPAPIQVNYLGYPGTMGAEFVDYLIGDPVVTPPEHAMHYTEKLVTMPHSYQPNDRHRPLPEKPGRAACGLPEQGFVFCGFNQTFKILPDVFDIWMSLLKAVPDSVLWLLQASSDLAEQNLRREAEARGVAAERLIFAPRLPLAEHLARQQQADLLLDTLPYNAHTTASDALWMGVPVITCMGETFASRVAASLLQSVGMPELITRSLQDYQAVALQLAQQPERLQDLKARLAAHRDHAPLFDTVKFTRDLETCYQAMWADYLGR